MKKAMKVLSLLLVLCISLTVLPGCSRAAREEKGSIALCIVHGCHENFPVVNLNAFYDKVYEACFSYGSVCAVAVDGQSRVVAEYPISPSSEDVDEESREFTARDNAETILRAMMSRAVAETPETDVLRALSLGGDLLAAQEAEKKELVVVDSLLSTTGLMDFTSANLIEQDPDAIVTQLETLHAIPDLSGVDVTVMGLGQTCGDQPRLTPDYSYRLEQIWRAILDAAGCRSVEISPTPLGSQEPKGLPHVTSVPVIADSLSFASAEQAIPEVIRLDETVLRFLPDSAQLADPEEAAQTLRPIAQVLTQAPDARILLAGMTASAGGDGLELSRARADKVKELLVSEGVLPQQVECIGLGCRSNCLRTPDLDAQGNLIEEQARKNRAVFLLLRDSETAGLLLAQTEELP